MTDLNSTDLQKKNRSSCAVFKTNLEGRFVAIDPATESLFGLSDDDLFGRSIRDFLDTESYQSVQTILKQTRRYEAFFEATDFVFIDAERNQHVHSVVISLNFVGGNPANFQFMVNTSCERQVDKVENSSSDAFNIRLFEYVSNLNGSIKWDNLGHILLDINSILAVGVHRYADGSLRPIYSAVKENCPENIHLPAITEEHHQAAEEKAVACFNVKYDDDDKEQNDYMESVFPLIKGGICWGIIRIIHSGELAAIKPDMKTIAAFLGNALFSFISEKSDIKRVSV